MSARPLLLDFQTRSHPGGWLGAAILTLGSIAIALIGIQFHAASQQREGLEMRLEALESSHSAVSSNGNSANLQEAGPVVAVLGAPWAKLLQELESASRDEAGSVAVLSVEPDREKGRVRIVAEARDLPMVLAYIQRLQKSNALRFPMLDSHEIRLEDRDQPVRFQLSADWKTS